MITTSTLYYFFSTIAQILAAISALLAVFTHFKINEIKEFLVGDGMATLKRMCAKTTGYFFVDEEDHKKYFERLRDAVHRKSILGILEVIELLSKYEKDEGFTLLERKRGLQYLEIRFKGRQTQISKIKSLTKKSIIAAFIAIFGSITSLLFVEIIYNNCVITLIIISLVLIITLISMIFTIQGIFSGLKDEEDV